MKLGIGNVGEEGIVGGDIALHEVDGTLRQLAVDHSPLIQVIDLYVFGCLSFTCFHHVFKFRQRTRVGAEARTLRPKRLVR